MVYKLAITDTGRLVMNGIEPTAVPDATYRVQLSHRFGFRELAELTCYLNTLGISHCYTSPYLKARQGSPHGYDVVDHQALNPELGKPDDYGYFIAQLQRFRMGHIIDFVPNHMGVMDKDNSWWLDVLENGPASIYADFFDIDWQPAKAELQGKVLLPVLGDHYGNVLESAELILVFDADQGEFSVNYFGHKFPVDPREYPQLLNFRHDILVERLGKDNTAVVALEALAKDFSDLPHRYEKADEWRLQRRSQAQYLKKSLQQICHRHSRIMELLLENVGVFNGSKDDLQSFDFLHHLLEAQAYRLAFWKVAGNEINYRRFFDINDLAGIRVEDPRVFEMTHGFIFQLIAERKIQGLRIDHIDGLNDPMQYLQRLQQRLQDILPGAADQAGLLPFYVVVEKILARHEHLDPSWPIAGSTGYEFAMLANSLFIDAAQEKPLTRFYHRFIGYRPDFDGQVFLSKKYVLSVPLASELNVLANQLARIAESDRKTRDFTAYGLHYALQKIVACFPVYRTYIGNDKISRSDSDYIEWAVSEAEKHSQADDLTVFDFIRGILLQEFSADKSGQYRKAAIDFARRLQQYTAPVMAKGVEDNALYKFCLLTSLNDVGGDPRQFGSSLQRFHHLNRERQLHWPHSQLNIATHDSKRSSDVRARINVLSELPEAWQAAVISWSRINRPKKQKIAGKLIPSRNDEYLLYQTLVGTWPLQEPDPATVPAYQERIQAYMLKAVREAESTSSWRNPDAAYETALQDFIAKMLEHSPNNLFLQEFCQFQQSIVPAGLLNALAQQLLLLTVPGMPDIYQGNELWNFTLVDPDNRQPVDFIARRQLLDELVHDFNGPEANQAKCLQSLTACPSDGRIKLYLTWKTLQFRRQNPLLFKQGHYQPLATKGVLAEHLVAFARIFQDQQVYVIVPRLTARLDWAGQAFPLAKVWRDTWIQVPVPAPSLCHNIFSAEPISMSGPNQDYWINAEQLFASLPMAMLA